MFISFSQVKMKIFQVFPCLGEIMRVSVDSSPCRTLCPKKSAELDIMQKFLSSLICLTSLLWGYGRKGEPFQGTALNLLEEMPCN